jgi:hypothetical protein
MDEKETDHSRDDRDASAYILVGIQLEERDLIKEHPEHAVYHMQVPMTFRAQNRRRNRTRLAACPGSSLQSYVRFDLRYPQSHPLRARARSNK